MHILKSMETSITAKPFLRWAGKKTQLTKQLIPESFPNYLSEEEFTYVEPFVGSGAMLFWVAANFPLMKRAIINDLNEDLINAYRWLSTNPELIIYLLKDIEMDYHRLFGNVEAQKEFYLKKREIYNQKEVSLSEMASLFIFLNRTCFNGLYRVNVKTGNLNVPFGVPGKPTICDTQNLLLVGDLLSRVEIVCGDFWNTVEMTDPKSFFYIDPPYKPLKETQKALSYTRSDFNDLEQVRLRDFCKELSSKGHLFMLSNSDVEGGGETMNKNFLESLYGDFKVDRISVRRHISADPSKRGNISELLIKNYHESPTI